jgi:hypothetical protein
MLTHIFAWVFAVLTLTMMAVNATLMLLSPRLWFRLPSWIRANARFTDEKRSTGLGAVQVRILGGVILLVLAIIVSAIAFSGE